LNTVQKRRRLRARREASHGGRPWFLIALLTIGGLGSLCAAAGLGSLFVVYNSYAKDYVPIDQKLHQVNAGLTEIYDRNGPCTNGNTNCVLLGNLANPDAQLLDPVPITKISPYLIQATISTEDNSFETNPGINVTGFLRAGFEYVLSGGNTSSGTGGSSITQQLVKNVYICPNVGSAQTICAAAPRTVTRKLKEIVLSLELTKHYTKDEILGWYLNQISYADRYIGIQAAAQGYFHINALDLDLAQSALLAGVPQFPTKYHPRLNCVKDQTGQCIVDAQGRTTVGNAAIVRQHEVLDLMVIHHRITEAQAVAAKAEVLKVYALSDSQKASAFIDDQIEPRLARMCSAGILQKLPSAANCEQSVASAGYQVTTTLDWAQTNKAEEMIRAAISTGLANNCACNNASIVTIEPSTGQIIVYAPNRDPSYTSDRRVAGDIDQLVEINQPGSSFKPAVYLAWFNDLNRAPLSVIWDTSPMTVQGTTIVDPRADGGNEGLITARAGLGGSQNVPAFRAASEVGPDAVIAMAKKLGITTLDQHFDPTFRSHPDITYGASIATGGANVRAIDMAYMNAVIANMGLMVGVPTLAKTVPLSSLKSLALTTGAAYDEALRQSIDFRQGNIRIPGTRNLDPVVILKVTDNTGKVLYDHATANDLKKEQVVNAGSVWLLQSIMTDCAARFIIWTCGSSNNDNDLDAFMSDGIKIPEGIKTGTQQGPLSASDTLATWMNGYSRYAATSVWVGNADKSLVHDGPRWNYASADTTIRLFKNWMGEYHDYLQAKGVFKTPANFDALKPANVAFKDFTTPTTNAGLPGGCDQVLQGWQRTDITYQSQCETKQIDTRNGLLATSQTPAEFVATRKFVILPALDPQDAIALAQKRGIPIAPTQQSTGVVAVAISNLSNGKTVGSSMDVVGIVQPPTLKNWKLEIGPGGNPSKWTTIGSGTTPTTGVLGRLDLSGLQNGVYTVRLSTDDGKGLSTSVIINILKGASVPGPFGTTTANGPPPTGLGPTPTPTNLNPPADSTPQSAH